MSTVRDLYEQKLAEHGELVSGRAGLDSTVSWAVTARTRTPALDPLQGGEIVLLPQAALIFLGGEAELGRILRGFQDGGAAAVCVWAPPDHQRAAVANDIGLPLILIREASAAVVERDLIDHITGQLRSRLRQQEDRQTDLLDALAANRGLDALIRVLAEHMGRQVTYLPNAGTPVVSSGVPPRLPSTPGMYQRNGSDIATVRREDEDGLLWVAPVQHRGNRLGLLVVAGAAGSPSREQSLALRQTAAAISVEQGRLDAAAEAEQRLRDSFYKDLFAGHALDTVYSRARSLGVVLPVDGTVVSLAPRNPEDSLPEIAKDRLHALLNRQGSYPFLDQGRTLLMLVPPLLRGDNTISLLQRSLTSLGAQVSVGVSDPVRDPRRIADAAEEAVTALLVGTRTRDGALTHFSDTGAYGLLAPLRNTALAQRMIEQLLGPLMHYDNQHNASLATTLEAYIALNGNASSTAHKLSLHRNSLSYRLRRIEDLVGLSLADSENRLLIALALRLRKLS